MMQKLGNRRLKTLFVYLKYFAMSIYKTIISENQKHSRLDEGP